MLMPKFLSKRRTWRKIVAALMAFMMWLHPVQAYDTDIITTLSGGVGLGKPNVLFVLDTSNSMNIATPWRALSATESASYNSHMEYLWNDTDYISSIGCRLSKGECNAYAANAQSAGAADPDKNSPMLSYDDILTRSWLPQGYFDPVSLKNDALRYANGTSTGDYLPRNIVRNYGGYDEYTNSCNTTGKGTDVCRRPIRSRFVWYSDSDKTLLNPGRPDLQTNPVDARLYSNSFNRFIGEDSVTRFSGSLQGGTLLRGGSSYFYPIGVNGGGNAIDTSLLQINETVMNGNSHTNICVSSYFGDQKSSPKAAFIPSTVYAPGPFPPNDGFLVSGWFRQQPFANTKGKNLENYPGLFEQQLPGYNGDQVGHRDKDGDHHNPVRVADAGTYSGWETLKPDLGGGADFFRAVYSYNNGSLYDGAWPEYGNSHTINNGEVRSDRTKLAGVLEQYGITKDTVSSSQIILRVSADPAANGQSVPLKDLVKNLGNPNINNSNINISIGKPWVPSFWNGTQWDARGRQDDPFYSYMALRGGANLRSGDGAGPNGADLSGPAGKLYGLSTYVDVASDTTQLNVQPCSAICDLAPGNTSAFIPSTADAQNGISGIDGNVFYNYEPPITCARKDKDTTCQATCSPYTRMIAIREITQCGWNGRTPKKLSETEIEYSGGTCTATCKGDCDHFNDAYTSGSIGNGRFSPGENTNQTKTSKVCEYARASGEDPAATTNDPGTCTLKPDIAKQINSPTYNKFISCPEYYAQTGTTHPNCEAYSLARAADNCQRTITGTRQIATNGASYVSYNFSQGFGTVMHECSADDGRLATDPLLANQITGFNNSNPKPSYMSAKKVLFPNPTPYDRTYTDTPSAAIANGPNAIVYSANYLNYLYGPKGAPLASAQGTPIYPPIARQTRLQIAKDVLVNIVDQKQNDFNFGLIAFNAVDPNKQGIGGHVVFPVSDLTQNDVTKGVANTTDLAEFKKRVYWLEAKSKTPLVETIYEAYLYFNGAAPSDLAKDYYDNKNIPANLQLANIVKSNGQYFSPIEATLISSGHATQVPQTYCQVNVIILITDGGPEADLTKNGEVQKLSYTHPITGQTIKAKGPWPDLPNEEPVDGQFAFVDKSGVRANHPYGPVDDADRTANNYSWLDELTYFMFHGSVYKAKDSNARNFVSTYTIGFGGVVSPVLEHAGDPAISGGSYYTADNAETLTKSIQNALVNTRQFIPTLSSPAVPISALTKAEDSQDIYISALKLADGVSMWGGNMKKYHLELGGKACGKDAKGNDIPMCTGGNGLTSNGTKNVATNTQDSNGNTYATFDPRAKSYWSTDADGADPLKGGVMDRLIADYPDASANGAPGNGIQDRNMRTYLTNLYDPSLTSGTGGLEKVSYGYLKDQKVLTDGFSAAAINATEPMKYTLINKILGADITQQSCSDPAFGPCRAWGVLNRHTAPLHSSGVVLTYKYGSSDGKTAPDQLLFYSTMNGVLHAVKTADEVRDNGGKEIWSFVPEEAIRNSITHPDNATIFGQSPKSTQGPIALLDGQPALYTKGSQGSGGQVTYTQAILIFGMRRGGSGYYALDVSDKDNPKFLWKIVGGQGVSGAGMLCSKSQCEEKPEYDELGQTWSTPTVVRLNTPMRSSSATGLNPLSRGNANFSPNDKVQALVFGGGWSPRQDCLVAATTQDGRLPANRKYNDIDCPSSSTIGDIRDNVGRAVYVVDVESGAPIKVFTRHDVAHNMLSKSGTKANAANISEILYLGGSVPNTENDNNNLGITMSNSIPGTVGAFNVDGNAANTDDRLYVGDMGGVLWRFDIQNIDPTKWRGYPIASLSTVDPSSQLTLNDRPIFYTPALLLSRDNAKLSGGNGQKYHYVYVATGDMEHPTIIGQGVNNKLFMIKDWERRLPTTLPDPNTALSIEEIHPAIVGTSSNLGDWRCGTGGSCLLNVSKAATLSPAGDPRNLAMNYLKTSSSLKTSAVEYDQLNGWYVDFDINSDGTMDPPSKRREVATSGVLIYKDENPASATYGFSVLNVNTFRYGVNSNPGSCVATGEGHVLQMEATTGVAFTPYQVAGTLPSGTNSSGAGAYPVRYGDQPGGYDNGPNSNPSGAMGQGSIIIRDCRVQKTAGGAPQLSSSYIAPACTATKTYWFNRYNNN